MSQIERLKKFLESLGHNVRYESESEWFICRNCNCSFRISRRGLWETGHYYVNGDCIHEFNMARPKTCKELIIKGIIE